MKHYKTTYIPLDKRVPGVLYEPEEKSGKQRIAILIMHSDEDYLSFISAKELTERGYTVLTANVRNKEGIIFGQPEKMKDVKTAVEFLRSLPGIEKIILLGHSGGGTLLSAYQAVAENGPEIFQGEEKIYPYPDKENLPPADGLMLLDSNWGNAAMQLFSLDPAVENEQGGKLISEELDLFNPVNGFDPNGSSYEHTFIRKFQEAQSERNCRLVDYALNRLLYLETEKGLFSDDEPMIIPGSAQGFFNNKLYAQDIRLMSHTQGVYPLLTKDGEQSGEIIRTCRGPENPKSLTSSFWEGGRFLSVRTYLNSYAVRTGKKFGYDEEHVWGIEWNSTYSCVPGNMEHIHVPVLIMGMTAGWEFLASELIYQHSVSTDRSIAFVKGATHVFRPAKNRESYPGEFGDTVAILHDYVDGWLESGRFI